MSDEAVELIKAGWAKIHGALAAGPEPEDFDYQEWEQALGQPIPETVKVYYSQANIPDERYVFDCPASYSAYYPIGASQAYSEWKVWVEINDDDPLEPEYWQRTWLPLAISGGGDSISLMLEEGGRIVEMLHDSGDRDAVADDLAALLAKGYADVDARTGMDD